MELKQKYFFLNFIIFVYPLFFLFTKNRYNVSAITKIQEEMKKQEIGDCSSTITKESDNMLTICMWDF
jgi:hypothetical protein